MRLHDLILVVFALIPKFRALPYFQFDDMFRAECIPRAHLQDYLYYGNASTYIIESVQTSVDSMPSLTGRCEVWKNVASAMIKWAVDNDIKDYWIYPDELMNHNNCRNFDLTLQNENNFAHLAVLMKIVKSSASHVGPWCYAHDPDQSKKKTLKSSYHVARCFPECVGTNYQGTTRRPGRTKISSTLDSKPNYNAELIDLIAAKAFTKYDWGPPAYYDSRPSDVMLSAEFERNRYSIFFAMIAVGMAIMMCSILFVIIKSFLNMRRKKKKAEKAAEKEASILNPIPRSAREMRKKMKIGTPV